MKPLLSEGEEPSWKKTIRRRLKERRERDQKPFEDVVLFCSKLFEAMDSLRNENVLLRMQSRSISSIDPSSSSSSLEDQKKMLALQEQLTELHRSRGENAQQIVSLRNTLEDKEREIKTWKQRCDDALISLKEIKETCKRHEENILDLERQKTVLSDEHTALQMAFSSLQTKHLSKEKEFALLLDRYIALKASQAEILNAENEAAMEKRREAQAKAIASAIKEMPSDSKTLERESSIRMSLDAVSSFVGCGPSVSCCLPSRKCLEFEAHDAEVNAVKFLTDESGSSSSASLFPSSSSALHSIVLTGGGDRKVKVWEVSIQRSTSTLRTILAGSNAAITSIDVEDQMVLASSNDFASRVWTLDGKLRRTLTGHSNKVLAAKFLAGNRVVSGSHDRTLKIWDLNRHSCIRTLFAGSSCNDLVICPGSSSEGATVISGHYDKRIRFWETRTDSTCNEILLEGRVTSVSINGTNLLVCARDDTLKQLDLRMTQVVRTFVAEGFKVGCDWTRATFSPDGEYVACGSNDGLVFVWNLNSGKIETTLKENGSEGHRGHNVITCSWSPNGKYFVSCDRSKRSIVWTD